MGRPGAVCYGLVQYPFVARAIKTGLIREQMESAEK
jgi:hypothetical protein